MDTSTLPSTASDRHRRGPTALAGAATALLISAVLVLAGPPPAMADTPACSPRVVDDLTDPTDPDGAVGEAVGALVQAGIIDGYADGTFGPKRPISRGPFASMVVRLDERHPLGG